MTATLLHPVDIFATEGRLRNAWTRFHARPRLMVMVGAVSAILATIPVAFLLAAPQGASPGQPEAAVTRIAAVFALILVAAPVAVIAARRRATTPAAVGHALLLCATILLAGSYLYSASPAILLRADIMIWSEGLFVGDILKARAGYPLFTEPTNLESTFYPPGASMLTYLLAKLTGFATSVPAYRVIQLGYGAIAAVVGALSAYRLVNLACPERPMPHPAAWGALWGSFLFLCATNAITSPFAHLLHNDALGVLLSSIAFWLLTEYAAGRRVLFLVLLAVVPAAGFYVKQSLVIWAALITGYLLVFDRPRSLLRTASYAVAAFGIAAAAFGAGWLAWGHDFYYWTILDLQNHPFSPLRSVRHALTAWAYFAAALAGALLLFNARWRTLAGLWVVAVLVLAQGAYTSGIAWMLNHMAPGSLLAGTWLAAGLAVLWSRLSDWQGDALGAWTRGALATAMVAGSFAGLGLVRIPMPELDADVDRYVSAIEREFAGTDPREILLDHGSWPYMDTGAIPKDRSALVGDLAYSGMGDFSGMIGRIRERQYRKILVRDYHADTFFYEYHLWDEPSGIRDALRANYREVRRIPAVAGQEQGHAFMREISVLEPLP